MSEPQRLFFAIDLPAEIREQIIHWRATHFPPEAGRPVAADNLHLTLAFLGEVSAEKEKALSLLAGRIRQPGFPDTDPAFKGADSRELLREAWRRIQAKGYTLGNVDVTIIAQAPKMLPHIPQMRVFIAEDLGCHMDDVNVKATTTEKLGFTGRGEGIACEAVALLIKATK